MARIKIFNTKTQTWVYADKSYGKTPVKGLDYFTEDDKVEFLNDVDSVIDNKIVSKQDVITGTYGQFVVIGADGKPTTKTIPRAEEAEF